MPTHARFGSRIMNRSIADAVFSYALVLIALRPAWAGAPPDVRSVALSPGSGGGPPMFGDPIPGLTDEQLALFVEGQTLFDAILTEAEGLGPIFNKEGCGTCHNAGPTGEPAIGGAGSITVTRFGRFAGKGQFDPMEEYGGSLRQMAAINDGCEELVPPEAEIVISRITTPALGAGLIEAIPDETLLALADPDDANGDGISGKAHIVFDPWQQSDRVGRFGWKAQVATLDTFSADASLNEMGMTNVLFGMENDPNGVFPPELADCDAVADPEDVPDANGMSKFNKMAVFQRLLAPPPRVPLLSGRGFALFRQIGCDDCHTPVMFTGDSDIAPLSHRPVFLYSDLLLHDMGALGDEIVQGDAEGTEMRTSPLWGLRVRPAFLHDGRAANENLDLRIREAIEGVAVPVVLPGHAGEAAASRNAWLALPPEDQQDIIDFLKSI